MDSFMDILKNELKDVMPLPVREFEEKQGLPQAHVFEPWEFNVSAKDLTQRATLLTQEIAHSIERGQLDRSTPAQQELTLIGAYLQKLSCLKAIRERCAWDMFIQGDGSGVEMLIVTLDTEPFKHVLGFSFMNDAAQWVGDFNATGVDLKQERLRLKYLESKLVNRKQALFMLLTYIYYLERTGYKIV